MNNQKRRHLASWAIRSKRKGQRGGFLISGIIAALTGLGLSSATAAAVAPAVATGVGAMATGAAGAVGANIANSVMGAGIRSRRRLRTRRKLRTRISRRNTRY